MSQAQLREQDIDRPDLQSLSPARRVQARRVNVILPVGDKKWQAREVRDDCLAALRPANPLQQLLENDAGREDGGIACECASQKTHFRTR